MLYNLANLLQVQLQRIREEGLDKLEFQDIRWIIRERGITNWRTQYSGTTCSS